MNATTYQIDLEGAPGTESRRQFLEIVLLSLAFSIVPASFVLFLIDERVCVFAFSAACASAKEKASIDPR